MTPIDVGHKVVSSEEWLEARKAHLAREKEFTRQRDELSRQRREKYVCLVYDEEKKLAAMSKSEFDALVGEAPDDEEETARDAREEMGT
jgi:hypothetical protein